MGRAGFTLVELLVGLSLMALALALVPVAFFRPQHAVELRSAVQDVAAGLRRARAEAMATNRPVAWLPPPPPDGIALRVITVDSELAAGGGIRFFADGSATGGAVELSSAAGRHLLRVDWLTGWVENHER